MKVEDELQFLEVKALSELVFATYLKELKNAWAEEIADPDLINLLYDAVSEPMELVNKENGTITTEKSAASKIVNRQKGGNALKVIRTNANKDKVRSSIEQYFEKNVVKRLHSDCIDDLISNLKKIIEGDSSISETKKEELLKNASRNKLAAFLGFTYLYSLTRDNVLKEIRIKTTQEIEDYKRHPLREIPTPPEVIEEERKYADALMAVYGQAEGIPNFDESMLAGFPKHQQHFSDQRGYYFAAEAVRRGTRDIYSDESQFDVLKNETYEGVKEVWEEEYKSGYARLRKVMSQASATRVDKCWLSRDTDWVGNPQKKGVCHFLVKVLILDSPILSLKEKKHKITEKEKATPGMRESLFKYIVNHYGNNQVIIAENEIPEGVDYSSVNLIEYTTDEREGTYGFLKSVKN